ncbi:hypothetical protein [Paractinoplanes toevensis]|uniref:SAM-dependent methyltransferase n=1 Tax=Paractinoplanes toevensis TaxID=571911 RepID=A0A919THF1_9ACTN|nr:hypothetical protein [Actinoplanes toevensis]GIM94001.1 hypothetical protein Ato02nite_057940 [Actinoplanes toevensis]
MRGRYSISCEHSSNPFASALTERLAALLPAGASIEDLGCGTGVPTAEILAEPDHREVGVDMGGHVE